MDGLVFTPDPMRDPVGKVFFALCKTLDTPRALGMWLRWKYGETVQLASMSINPRDYTARLAFFDDYSAHAFIKKYKGLASGNHLRDVALQKFATSEVECLKANWRIKNSRLRGYSPRVDAVISMAQRKIASILKPLCTHKVLLDCGWGPGSTYDLKGVYATLVDKIGHCPITVTSRALPYLKAHIEADHHWFASWLPPGTEVVGPYSLLPCCFKVVEGCRVTTVPKDAKGDRTIAIEPTGNIFLQKGVGNYLRNRLKRFGVDLDSQERNQYLAKVAFDQNLCTVDLSSASDTVCRELVYELLPLDWAILLDQLRSPKAKIGKDPFFELQKFSSMGNGFTFELESLLFFALTKAVAEVLGVKGAVAVYGDDIICPAECYPLLEEVLSWAGFTINKEKSYYDSYFRESCGKHYWQGEDVTPVYQKDPILQIEEGYRAANRLIRLALRRGGGRFLDSRCFPAYKSARGIISGFLNGRKPHVVPLYPDENSDYDSDEGLALPKEELESFIQASGRFWLEGYLLPVLSFRPKFKNAGPKELALLSYTLRFNPEEPFNGRVPIRRRGAYVSRRRWFPLGASDVAWL